MILMMLINNDTLNEFFFIFFNYLKDNSRYNLKFQFNKNLHFISFNFWTYILLSILNKILDIKINI